MDRLISKRMAGRSLDTPFILGGICCEKRFFVHRDRLSNDGSVFLVGTLLGPSAHDMVEELMN